MRSVITSLVLIVLTASPGASAAGQEPPTREDSMVLVDFSARDRVIWRIINDGVMGGVSRSTVTRSDGETGLFTGELSLENNGGFASMRADLGRRDLAAHDGLELRVKGDGRRYQLRLRTDERFDGVAYRASFATQNGEWLTLTIPFDRFQPTFRGRILDDVPPLETSSISQLGFLLADKQAGSFSLEIDFVRTWDAPKDR